MATTVLDPVANFAIVDVSTGYNSSATSIVLVTGEGSKLKDPATDGGSYNLVWWNGTDYDNPINDNDKEIVRVTAKSGDTLTVTRAQEGTSASDHNTPGKTYRMVQAITEKMINDIDSNLGVTDDWRATTVQPTRTSADDPTYVVSIAGEDYTDRIAIGNRLKWTQNSTVRYGIVTAISFSTNTSVTIYGGTDYDVDDTGSFPITGFSYSSVYAPLGFPLDKDKWTVEVTDTTDRTQSSPSNGVWYNLGSVSIDIPIGDWDVSYNVISGIIRNPSSTGLSYAFYTTLSTSSSSASDSELIDMTNFYLVMDSAQINSHNHLQPHGRSKDINLASKITHYVITRVGANGINTLLNYNSTGAPLVVRARSNYI